MHSPERQRYKLRCCAWAIHPNWKPAARLVDLNDVALNLVALVFKTNLYIRCHVQPDLLGIGARTSPGVNGQ